MQFDFLPFAIFVVKLKSAFIRGSKILPCYFSRFLIDSFPARKTY